MKKILICAIALFFWQGIYAQCTPEKAAQEPFSLAEWRNYFKFIGTDGQEIKANTEIMYKKMKAIVPLFENALKDIKGIAGEYRVQVDNISNEGVVKGLIHIEVQSITCKKNSDYHKEISGLKGASSYAEFKFYINCFEPMLIRDKRKADLFILDGKKCDTLNGQNIYFIATKQKAGTFKGFPLYFGNLNTDSYETVIITKPTQPLFKPIRIGEFLGLFKTWTTAYNAVWHRKPAYMANPEKIDQFYNSCTPEFLKKPTIYVWESSEQIPYLNKKSYADNGTQGKQWVVFNGGYIPKNAPAASLQFVNIKFPSDAVNSKTLEVINAFKNKFDFKILQEMLDK